MFRREFIALGLALPLAARSISASTPATTWFPKEFDCPVCETKNTYMVVGSYGSYIYSWPSKYQLIYWPVTVGNTFYLCKKCHLSVFMWDHDDLPKYKIPAMKKTLSGVTVEKKFEEYTEVPVFKRLEIVEKVYGHLDKDDAFWNFFYRIKGYHFQDVEDMESASAARKKALEIVTKMIAAKDDSVAAKELWAISGAMKHFTMQDKAALEDLNKAMTVKYDGPDLTEEEKSIGETNINSFLVDYINRINGANPPRDSDQ
ncbi:MAG: hypothetical protein DWQ47_01150 [Acidobacteria bacterium]|nr:MAG: hypothetical protein DWQ32_11610 [Acidobacteriota bacterium]REK04108.1 MAG: hypothetical protein DWQ38_01135 [Acidobacteriota bacterium]REK15270.1 MAG: hypothetical protein DWQ43_17300 [Acidobacteriota bacterium]REK46360.1 MAG: hypothetical protein DWQ47_01150 [Acidobacteriota bacterium]